MKTLLIVVAVIAVLGGGFYWYTSMQQAAVPAATGTSMNDTNGAAMDTTNTDAGAPAGTNTGAAATVHANVDVGATAGEGKMDSFTVTGSNYAMSPKTLSVKKGDTVKITFTNAGGMHDFVIDEFSVRTNRIQGGASQTVTFVADKTGSFQYYCSVGQHRDMGMWGTLTVTP